MSARSTPVKKPSGGSPASSVRSTPNKSAASTPSKSANVRVSLSSATTPSKSPSSAASTPAKPTPSKAPTPAKTSSAVKAHANGSWNLQGVDGGTINLETNVVHQAFQINKQLIGNGLDVEEEAKEVERLTARKLEEKTAKVEAFQSKTEQRAEAARKASRKFKKGSKATRPVSAPLSSTLRASPARQLSRREAIAAEKAAAAALLVKPLLKKRGTASSTATSAATAANPNHKKKPTVVEVAAAEAKIKHAQQLAARRAKDAALKEELKSMEAKEKAATKPVKVVKERAPLDAPLQRRVAEKTTAPQPMEQPSFNINDMSVLQLSGLVSADGSESYIGVDPTMSAAFEALSKVNIASIREVAGLRKPSNLVELIMEAVCILVGEDQGWVTAQRLIKRRDFFPALAVSTVDNIPFARIKKFRSRKFLKNPSFNAEQAFCVGGVAVQALCLWVLAIDSAAPPAPTAPTYPDSMSPNMMKAAASPLRASATASASPSRASNSKSEAKATAANSEAAEEVEVVRISSDLAKTILGAKLTSSSSEDAAADADDMDVVSVEEVAVDMAGSDTHNSSYRGKSISMSTAEADAEFVAWLKTEAKYKRSKNGLACSDSDSEDDSESEESGSGSEDYEPDTGSSPYMVHPPTNTTGSGSTEEEEDEANDAYGRLGNAPSWDDVDNVSDFMDRLESTTQQSIYAEDETYTQ